MRFRHSNRQFNTYKERILYNRNEYIQAEKLLVIDEQGNQLGVLSKAEALGIAKEKFLDLIEVAPKADPPVAKIYSWSKFKYELDKKKKDNKSRPAEMKEMWFKIFIGTGDFEHKIELVKKFLEKKHPVKITIKAKGRIKKTQLSDLLNKILESLREQINEAEEGPKFDGRNLTHIVRPIKK